MNILSIGGELNHHGRFVCDAFYSQLSNSFRRITTKQINTERLNLGYEEIDSLPYNINKTSIDIDFIKAQIEWADIVEFGDAPEEYLNIAVASGKKVFIRMERLFKEGYLKILHPRVLKKYFSKYIQYKKNTNVYFLCIGAYVAQDLKLIGVSNERVLQWAYCPEFFENERFFVYKSVLKIAWVGRLIKWKHPEVAINIAYCLKKRGIPFEMSIIGEGPNKNKLKSLIKDYSLEKEVMVVGAIPPKEVRTQLISSDIFIASSDKNEGWGVVINEAMNAGCVVFASREMGAAPILIKDGFNGYLFNRKKLDLVVDNIQKIYTDQSLIREISQNAYTTIMENFTPEKYATTFIKLSEDSSSVNSDSILGTRVRKYHE